MLYLACIISQCHLAGKRAGTKSSAKNLWVACRGSATSHCCNKLVRPTCRRVTVAGELLGGCRHRSKHPASSFIHINGMTCIAYPPEMNT